MIFQTKSWGNQCPLRCEALGMDNHDLEGNDFSRSVGVYCSPKGAAVTFLVFAFHGKALALYTRSITGRPLCTIKLAKVSTRVSRRVTSSTTRKVVLSWVGVNSTTP